MAELKTQFEVDPAPALKSALLRSPVEWQKSLSQARTWDWEIRRKYKLGEGYLQEKVQKVADKIVTVSHFKDFPIKVIMVEDPNENAFATGGEYVYVHTGLLNHAESEDEIAFVVGHEIAHNFAAHPYRQQRTMPWIALSLALADWVFKGQTADEIIGFAAKYLPPAYSRRYEREADILGAYYTHKAGYDYLKAIKLFERMWAEEEKNIAKAEQEIHQLSYQYQIAYRNYETARINYQTYSIYPKLAYQAQYYYQQMQIAYQEYMKIYNEYQKATQNYMKIMEQTYYFRTHPPFQERISLISQTVNILKGKGSLDTTENAIQYVFRTIGEIESGVKAEVIETESTQSKKTRSLYDKLFMDKN